MYYQGSYNQISNEIFPDALVHDSLCNELKKPESIVKCKLTECPNSRTIPRTYFDRTYKWKIGPWKKVSKNPNNTCSRIYWSFEQTRLG